MQIIPKLLNISQAANLLGVSKDTLRRWEKNGLISPIRTAGRVRKYSWEDLRAARLNRGRRLYRMKQLFSHHKPVIQTIFLTSLFWILIILAMKIGTPQQTTVLLPALSDTPKTDLRYSDNPQQYFLLQPLGKNVNPTVIKRI